MSKLGLGKKSKGSTKQGARREKSATIRSGQIQGLGGRNKTGDDLAFPGENVQTLLSTETVGARLPFVDIDAFTLATVDAASIRDALARSAGSAETVGTLTGNGTMTLAGGAAALGTRDYPICLCRGSFDQQGVLSIGIRYAFAWTDSDSVSRSFTVDFTPRKQRWSYLFVPSAFIAGRGISTPIRLIGHATTPQDATVTVTGGPSTANHNVTGLSRSSANYQRVGAPVLRAIGVL